MEGEIHSTVHLAEVYGIMAELYRLKEYREKQLREAYQKIAELEKRLEDK